MIFCNCILAGTAACRNCSNNPNANYLPTVCANTVVATDKVLITGVKTYADRIRAMTDEELAHFLAYVSDCSDCPAINDGCGNNCDERWLEWLKLEAKNGK